MFKVERNYIGFKVYRYQLQGRIQDFSQGRPKILSSDFQKKKRFGQDFTKYIRSSGDIFCYHDQN